MSLFLKLYLAHVLADFILQFEELYQLKLKSKLGHFFHVFIHFIVSILLVLPYINGPFLIIFITVITIIHYGQDQIKYRLQKNEKIMFPCFIIDQIFHFLFIASILLFPASRIIPEATGNYWIDLYLFDDTLTLYAIAFLLSTFGGAYTLHAFRKTYVKETRPDHLITSFELTHGILERGIVTLIVMSSINLWAMLLIPLVAALRLPFAKLRNKTDILLSFVFALVTGVFFRLCLLNLQL